MKPNEKPELLNAGTPKGGHVDQNRRKLAGFGASAIFTLASRPVMAGGCVPASAAATINVSFNGTMSQCNGDSAADYAAALNSKNSDTKAVKLKKSTVDEESVSSLEAPASESVSKDDLKFHDIFMKGRRADWENKRFSYVLTAVDNANTGTEANPISKEFVAAFLNIQRGLIPDNVLNDVKLIGMWNEWVDAGIFRPQAGIQWGSDQIVTYLQSLQA